MLNKINIKGIMKNKSGITGVDTIIAISIFVILTPLVLLVFLNIYNNTQNTKRNAEATKYATQILEDAEKIYYDDVTIANLDIIKDNLNIPQGYEVNITVTNYNESDPNLADIVKTIEVTIHYKVGSLTESIKISKIRSKENLVTPNRPSISDGMVPVKYVITDEATGEGYWQVTSTNDPTWYSYENRKWANVMLMDGIQIEGNIQITDENKEQLAGKRVMQLGSMFVWIPRYSYKITYYTTESKTTVKGYMTAKGYTNAGGTVLDHDTIFSQYSSMDVKFLFHNSNDYIENGRAVNAGTNDYIVHPAFKNGKDSNFGNGNWDKEISGIWIAKFEAGFQASTVDNAGTLLNGSDIIRYSELSYTSNNSSCTVNALNQNLSSGNYANERLTYPVFKPLTYSYNIISAGDSYILSKEIVNATSVYGLKNTLNNSHMMKNSEWGALAYLTSSKYGKNGRDIHINNLNLNNRDSRYIYSITGLTGASADEISTTNISEVKPYYEATQGVLASSTGNVTGVYDLSGGAYERVAAYIADENSYLQTYGRNLAYHATENRFINENTKWSNKYDYNTSSNTSTNNYLIYKNAQTISYGFGDAMLETSSAGTGNTSWLNDSSVFPCSYQEFICRGGAYSSSSEAGIFNFYNSDGIPSEYMGFRVTLSNL